MPRTWKANKASCFHSISSSFWTNPEIVSDHIVKIIHAAGQISWIWCLHLSLITAVFNVIHVLAQTVSQCWLIKTWLKGLSQSLALDPEPWAGQNNLDMHEGQIIGPRNNIKLFLPKQIQVSKAHWCFRHGTKWFHLALAYLLGNQSEIIQLHFILRCCCYSVIIQISAE